MKKWNYTNNMGESDSGEHTDHSNGLPIYLNLGGDGQVMAPTAGIRVVEDKILFYGDIDEGSMLELNRVLLESDLKAQHTKTILGAAYNPTIHLHISTGGGSIYPAFAAVDTIRRLRSTIHTYVDGSVASAGTLITAMGSKRYIGQHGHMLIHQLSSGLYGKYSEMEEEMVNLTSLMKTLKDFYKKHTKLPMKKLDEILKKDLWLNAQECVDYGLVDEII